MKTGSITLLAAILLLGVRDASAQEAQYVQALRVARAKEYEAALAGLRAIARESPSFDRAYRAMAAVAVASGRVKELRAELEAQRGAATNTVYVDYALGELWLAQGNGPLAEQAASNAIRSAPRFIPAYDTWVRAMRLQRRLPQAETWLHEQVNADPRNPAPRHALGVSMLFLARRREALAYFDDALRIKPDLLESLYGSHLAHYDSQEYAETLTVLDAMQALISKDDLDWRYYIDGRRGVVFKDMGRYTPAVSLLEFATATARDLGDVGRQTHFESQLATVYGRLGDYEKAFASATEVLNLVIKSGDRLAEGRTRGQLARFHAALSHYNEAIRYFQSAVDIARQVSDKGSEADQLKGLAEILAASGKLAQALERITLAIEITRTLENTWLQARYLIAKASIQRELGQFRQALDTAREAERLAALTDDEFAEASAALTAGEMQLVLNAHREARARLAHALDLARTSQAREIDARARVASGRLATSEGRRLEAIENYQAALTIGSESRSPELLWLAQRGLAETYHLDGQLEQAAEHYRNAIVALEKMRAGLGRPEDRAAFLASRLDGYRQAVSILVTLHRRQPRRGYDAEAFSYVERGRARSYLEMIGESRGDRSGASDPSSVARERQLHSQIAFHQSRLIEAHAARKPRAAIATLQQALAKADEAYNLFLWEEGAATSGAVQDLQALRLDEAQRRLGSRRVLLEYSLGPHESYLFAVDADRLRIYRLPGTADLERDVKALRAAITEGPAVARLSNYVVAARNLYRTLIQPAAAMMQGKSALVVVPDGILHYLPFEVLLRKVPSGSARIDPAALPYLIRDWAVSYAPSMSVLATLESSTAQSRTENVTLLAYGDPSYTTGAGRTAATRSFFDAGPWTIGELPHSRQEVETIAGLFSPSRVTLRTGPQATEAALKSDANLSEYRVLHFAMHGLMHVERPSLSGLVFSLPETTADERGEDGLLQAYEIVNLTLKVDLVVLSACETGLGKQLPGEGLVGLTQAFMHAGAGAVAGSLWKVADASSADLMLQFYQRLRAGSNFAAALREAKLEQIRQVTYAHPYHWAGYILAGRNVSLDGR